MAQLPTPTVSGAFSSASRVDGFVTWASMDNLEDLDQVRVRYARATGAVAPSAADLASRAESTGGWSSFSTGGRSYEYRDDVITSGFDNIGPSYTDREVMFNESSLTGYNVWAIARLEV